MVSENRIGVQYTLPRPRTVTLDNSEFNDTRSAFDHVFGNTATGALNWHVDISRNGYNPKRPYNFGKSKERFIKGLQEIIRRRTTVSTGITYERLEEMIYLAIGDWWDVKTIRNLYIRTCELTESQPEEDLLQ